MIAAKTKLTPPSPQGRYESFWPRLLTLSIWMFLKTSLGLPASKPTTTTKYYLKPTTIITTTTTTNTYYYYYYYY